MKKFLEAIVFIFFYFCLCSLYADEIKIFTLKECIDIALKKNPDVLASIIYNVKETYFGVLKLLRQALLNLKVTMGVVDMPDFDVREEIIL